MIGKIHRHWKFSNLDEFFPLTSRPIALYCNAMANKKTPSALDDWRTLSIRIPPEMRENLERAAEETTLPLTLFVRMLLKEWLDAHAKSTEPPS